MTTVNHTKPSIIIIIIIIITLLYILCMTISKSLGFLSTCRDKMENKRLID